MSPAPRPSAWHRLARLSARDFSLTVEAWFRLAAAAIRLRIDPRRTVERGLLESAAPAKESPRSIHSAAIAHAVGRAAAHHLGPMTCLPRSLALRRMLAQRGISSRLRIGVRKEGGAVGAVGAIGGIAAIAAIAAHAWVEVDGAPLGEPQAIEERFLPLLDVEREE